MRAVAAQTRLSFSLKELFGNSGHKKNGDIAVLFVSLWSCVKIHCNLCVEHGSFDESAFVYAEFAGVLRPDSPASLVSYPEKRNGSRNLLHKEGKIFSSHGCLC